MKALLELDPNDHADLLEHLLERNSLQEQAAFLFVAGKPMNDRIKFQVIDSYKATADDFASQEGDYLELADDARKGLIKRAHELNASLVEIHSHPGPWPAGFSLADRIGLQETVPHMWWRLKGRPYLAIVVAKSGFDALVWLDNPKIPQPLAGILLGQRILMPTNNSLEGWHE